MSFQTLSYNGWCWYFDMSYIKILAKLFFLTHTHILYFMSVVVVSDYMFGCVCVRVGVCVSVRSRGFYINCCWHFVINKCFVVFLYFIIIFLFIILFLFVSFQYSLMYERFVKQEKKFNMEKIKKIKQQNKYVKIKLNY